MQHNMSYFTPNQPCMHYGSGKWTRSFDLDIALKGTYMEKYKFTALQFVWEKQTINVLSLGALTSCKQQCSLH